MSKQSAVESESDGDASDDDELLMAASAWASAQNGEKEEDDSIDSHPKPEKSKHKKDTAQDLVKSKTNDKPPPPRNSAPQNYSLHLTKVPYEATQTDIRFAFGQKGCNVTSVRLVYDRDQKTGEKHFRGVAFVDLADEKSFKKGLEFNMKPFLGKGRKVNVRPTRTKSELSEIVRKTEEKVANLIARSKENAQAKKRERGEDGSNNNHEAQDEADSSRINKKRKKDRKKKRKSSGDGSTDKTDTPAKKAKHNDTKVAPKGTDKKKAKRKSSGGSSYKTDTPAKKAKHNDTKEAPDGSDKKKTKSKQPNNRKDAKPSKNADGSPVKLTKKQRAKKAAVIRMMKLKGKK